MLINASSFPNICVAVCMNVSFEASPGASMGVRWQVSPVSISTPTINGYKSAEGQPAEPGLRARGAQEGKPAEPGVL